MASFGENLRRERELRGVSLREIADATKISVRFLQALEDDRVDVLPGGLFPKAFVRQYARQLGLDAERYVAEFLYVAEERPPSAAPARVRFASPSARAHLLWRGGRGGPGPVLEARRLARARGAPRAGGCRDSDRGLQLPRAHRPISPPLATAVSTPDGLVLTLTAQQDCWVEARADGQTVLNRVLAGGETTTLEAHGQIVLSVGNAGGLAFRVNDRPGVPLGKTRRGQAQHRNHPRQHPIAGAAGRVVGSGLAQQLNRI